MHALCWIHAERIIAKIIPFTEEQRIAVESTREKIWDFYIDLKHYKQNPADDKKNELTICFDEIFQEKTCFITLNNSFEKLKSFLISFVFQHDYTSVYITIFI